MIFDENWNEVTEEQIKEKTTQRNIIIFGASLRNKEIFQCIPKEKVSCIYDNNESKWGDVVEELEVKHPQICRDEILVTAVEDYQNLVPQLESLGFRTVYYFMRDDIYETRHKAYIEFFRGEKADYAWIPARGYFKYVHVFADDKFFLPMINILEKGFDIYEHAFLIYKINMGNKNNKYRTWEKYRELSEKYHNVILAEDGNVIPELPNRGTKLEEAIFFIETSEKIIFHGEWMDEKIRRFFCQEELFCQVKKKGVWTAWSGNVGKDARNKIYIESLLKHCKVFINKRIGTVYSDLCKNVDMPKHFFYDKGATYSWILDRPKKIFHTKNVLLSQSCYPYNKNLETLQLLEQYKNGIDVYCIVSYGDFVYIKEVIQEGKRIFGNRFHTVDYFMPYAEYVDFLNTMDVAVYGMELAGSYDTLRILFWLKKKVYLKKGSPVDLMTRDDGFQVYDYYHIPEESIEEFFEDRTAEENYKQSLDEFDKEKIIERWRGLFELDMDNLELK